MDCYGTAAQVIDAEQMLSGQQALLKVQVTHCGAEQTMLGITIAQVLSGSPQCRIAAMCLAEQQPSMWFVVSHSTTHVSQHNYMASVNHNSTAEQGRRLVIH